MKRVRTARGGRQKGERLLNTYSDYEIAQAARVPKVNVAVARSKGEIKTFAQLINWILIHKYQDERKKLNAA